MEKTVREYIVNEEYECIDSIIDELCRDYAYALHQPMARNAGLMGLAAAAIALGNKYVGNYLDKLLPPVLACFGDQNDQVRFYSCESLYNIAKIAKGDILVYFNEIFDVLCKISADTDTSVKGAAELLDRLIKDIASECASTHLSVVNNNPDDLPPATMTDPHTGNVVQIEHISHLAFSLPKFIPLLSERIHAINPNTRMFLVSWLQVLENIPDLELISYLPTFLPGLFVFLGDSHKDVRIVTHSLINLLLHGVERISEIKNIVKEQELRQKQKSLDHTLSKKQDGALITERKRSLMNKLKQLSLTENVNENVSLDLPLQEDVNSTIVPQYEHSNELETSIKLSADRNGALYYPGQDIQLDFSKIIQILINNSSSSESEIQSVVLTWIETILKISPEDFLPYLSKLLSVLLKILNDSDHGISQIAQNVNSRLIELTSEYDSCACGINYASIINTLVLHFLDSSVITKVACLDWLILIYNKDPKQLIEHDDNTFLTLLKSLSDKDSKLIAKALELISYLCNDSNEMYFTKFITSLLKLFKDNENLLKTRSNYILRQLCMKLSSEKIYKVMSLIVEKDDDMNFVRMIIQILSTNLITSSGLTSLRKKLRSEEGWEFFTTLFKSWSYNPISLITMCLISEQYELAYSVLQIYVDYDLSVVDFLQIDILVQFLESPVFTRLRLQLLEQEKYPYLYKCLYGILMILPQSKAFTILNSRLNSVNKLASQSIFHGHVNTSNESFPYNISDMSLESPSRSINQKKPQCHDLLGHFKQISENVHNNSASAYFQEENFSKFNELLTPQSSFEGPDPPSIHNSVPEGDTDNVDTGSVILHTVDSTGSIGKTISRRIKSFGGH